jgi:hypothetical protein
MDRLTDWVPSKKRLPPFGAAVGRPNAIFPSAEPTNGIPTVYTKI